MGQKELGYVELNWTCPNCQGKNPGTVRTCQNCGSPQPQGIEFEQAQGAEIRTDEATKQAAQAGADIHCPYCGTRNRGDAKSCVQCGGDLSEGARRKAGQTLGAYQAAPSASINCPNCATANPASRGTCQNCGAALHATAVQPASANPPAVPKKFPVWLVALIVVVCLGGAALLFMLLKTESQTGTIQAANWVRTIPIEALGPVEYRDWQDQIPQQAELGACTQELRQELTSPVASAVEICGTPYTVDTGSGLGKVVQDCKYQVFDDYCSFTVQEWVVVDSLTAQGDHLDPLSWPEATLSEGQRLGGNRQESFTIVIISDGKLYTFETSRADLFNQAVIGDEWQLELNGLGQLVNVEP